MAYGLIVTKYQPILRYNFFSHISDGKTILYFGRNVSKIVFEPTQVV